MNHRIFTNLFWCVFPFAGVFPGAGFAIAQTLTLQPQQPYDQCQSLTSGNSTDDGLTRTINLLKDREPKVRMHAAQELAKSCDKRATEQLVDLLHDQEISVRLAAIEALGKLGDRDSLRPMGELISEEDWRVRIALIRSLASFKIFEARVIVLNGITNPGGAEITDVDDMTVRCIAILTVNQFTDVVFSRKSLLFLNTFLQSKHEPIRKIAEQTMVALKDTRNGPSELVAMLKLSSNPEFRRWAASWIGKLGIERGRDALSEAAAKDASAEVKQAAVEALKALGNGKKEEEI